MQSNLVLVGTAITVFLALLQYFMEKKKFPTELEISHVCLILDTTLEFSGKHLAPQSLQICVFSLAFFIILILSFQES